MDAYEEALETPYLMTAPNSIELGYIGWIQSIDFIPWCFKFLLAIPSDSINFMGYGHRRPFVVIGLFIGGLSFGGLAFFPAKLYASVPYMAMMILRNIGIGIADCAVDGLSVDAGIESESGALQGWMSLGRTVGTVVACLLTGNIAMQIHDKEKATGKIGAISGYQTGILISSAFVFLPTPMNWLVVEEWDDAKVYADKIQAAADAASREAAASTSPNSVESFSSDQDFLGDETPVAAVESAAGVVVDVNVDRSTLPLPLLLAPIRVPPSEKEAGKAQKIARRPSFVARVATASGFDFDLLCEVVGQRHVWMFLAYIFFTTCGIAVANFSLSSWLLDDLGFSEVEIGEAMSVMSVGCFAISLPLGYAFDAIPYKRTLLFAAAAVCAASNFALAFCNTKPLAILGLLGFGAAHGAIFVVQNSMARILADSRIAAVFFGIVSSVCNIAHFVGTMLTGYVVDSHLDYKLRPWSNLELVEPVKCVAATAVPESVYNSHLAMFAPCATECAASPFYGRCEFKCSDECPPYSDYNLSFYLATAIDVFATCFVFLIPGDKLTVKEDHLGLRILPHRSNLAFVEPSARVTARNTTASALPEVTRLSGGASSRRSPRPDFNASVPMSAALAMWLTRTGRTLTGSGTTVYAGAAVAESTVPPFSYAHTRILEVFGLGAPAPYGILGTLTKKKVAEARARTPTSPKPASRRSSVGEAVRGLNSEAGRDAHDRLVTTTSLMARLAAVQPFAPSCGVGLAGNAQGTSICEEWGSTPITVNPLVRAVASPTARPPQDSVASPGEWAPTRR